MNIFKRRLLLYVAIFLCAFIISSFIANIKGDNWEQVVRNRLYSVTGDSIPDFAVEDVDAQGVPFVFYPQQNGVVAGKQYNATIVANYAIAYYKDYANNKTPGAKSNFFNCISWLSTHMTHTNNYALFVFNWQQPWYDPVRTPFTSGMTSGLALQALTMAMQLNDSRMYQEDARQLLRGFYLPIQNGGFTYKTPGGWWFEELADTAMHSPFILDGHIFATLGVHAYWKFTKSDSAKYVFDKGVQYLKEHLHQYDAGDHILYDKYGKVADKKYHRILVKQMEELWLVTKDPYFFHYYKNWQRPLLQPYLFRILKEQNVSGMVLIILLTLFFSFAIFIGARSVKLV